MTSGIEVLRDTRYPKIAQKFLFLLYGRDRMRPAFAEQGVSDFGKMEARRISPRVEI